MLSQEFKNKMQIRLEEEKKSVESEIAKLSAPEESMDNPDAEDIAQDATEDIVSQSLLSIHRNILEKIDNALYRIKDGTYGRCLLCGAKISETELEKEPWAEHCVVCGK
jgi:RNA polymerase-binding protein DksA